MKKMIDEEELKSVTGGSHSDVVKGSDLRPSSDVRDFKIDIDDSDTERIKMESETFPHLRR